MSTKEHEVQPKLTRNGFLKLTGYGLAGVAFGGVLESCSKAITQAPTLKPSENESIATIPPEQVGGIEGIPDPKISNPELFDLTRKDAPIPQFVNAMRMAGTKVTREEVLAGLHPTEETPQGQSSFMTYRTVNGVALLMAEFDQQRKEWSWEATRLGKYWHNQKKWVGISTESKVLQNEKFRTIILPHFKNGILSVNDIEESGPDVKEKELVEVKNVLTVAEKNKMTLSFPHVVEPDKFPDNVDSSNVDKWLKDRLSEMVLLKKSYNNQEPIVLVYNGGFGEGRDPLKNRYRSNWASEYIFQVLDTFIKEGFVPNKDFVIQFNEDDLFGFPSKQAAIDDTLKEARQAAIDRLSAEDKELMDFLSKNDIKSVNDLQILVGAKTRLIKDSESKTHNGLGFDAVPTLDEINSLADRFEDIGGIILTEIDLSGLSNQEKLIFLQNINELLRINPNLRGAIFQIRPENQGKKPDANQSRSLMTSIEEVLPLFNFDGNPSNFYFELLKTPTSY